MFHKLDLNLDGLNDVILDVLHISTWYCNKNKEMQEFVVKNYNL